MTEPLSAIVVDDEPKVRDLIVKLVKQFCPEVTVCAEAGGVEEAFEKITIHKPALLFLDIEMPGANGFDLLRKFDEINFSVVFVTAYDHYALDAIKFNALDYVLKPIQSDQLIKAVNRFVKNGLQSQGIHSLLANSSLERKAKKVAIPSVAQIQYIRVGSIAYIEADGAYCKVYSEDGSAILSTRPIKAYEQMLESYGFFRLNRFYLINLERVKTYDKNETDAIELDNGKMITFSRKRRSAFMEAMRHQNLVTGE
jgi:two-component system LytT family response regulator